MDILKADPSHASEILNITKAAFQLYLDALNDSDIPVGALQETLAQTQQDIAQNHVYVALQEGAIVGCIRWERLSNDLAYIYRFAVSPQINNTGVGSALIDYCTDEIAQAGISAIALHTNSRYYRLARYYYGKGFFVHSTDSSKGYIRALFVKELTAKRVDLTPAFQK